MGKARDRAHILAGLAVAVANIDEIIALIRNAPDPQTAREQLMAKAWPAEDVAPLIALLDEPGHRVEDGCYTLSEAQARAILELRLHRLTGLERDKIGDDLREIGAKIAEYLEILGSREKLYGVLREELVAVREEFANERRTQIEDKEFETDIEDLIQREDMVVTVTNEGYIKRVPLSTYRAQRRGGKGRSGMSTRGEDFVSQVFVVNTHTPVLFFSSAGMVYKEKVYRLPLGNPQARGKALVNVLPLDVGETITTLMPLPEDESTWSDLFVMFATASGNARRNRLSDFVNVKSNGKIAMKLNEGDRLIGVSTCSEDQDILLAVGGGKCIRFPVTDVRIFAGRDSTGVRGIRLAEGDEVISMSVLNHSDADSEQRDAYLKATAAANRLEAIDYTGKADDKASDEVLAAKLSEPAFAAMAEREEFLLTITENGYGKRTSTYEYRITKRGGQGVTNIVTSERNGQVVWSYPVDQTDQLVMVSDGGQLIRTGVGEIRIAGRNTQGVTIFRTAEDEKVVSVTRLSEDDEEDENEEGGEAGAEAPVTEAEAEETAETETADTEATAEGDDA